MTSHTSRKAKAKAKTRGRSVAADRDIIETKEPAGAAEPQRRMRFEDRRASIIAAAKVVIARDGPAVSMQAIATEAGVTKPILYRAFGDRHGLVATLAQEFADELSAGLDAALALVGDLGDPDVRQAIEPRRVVVAAVDSYVRLIDRDPNLYRFITERLGDDTAIAPIDTLARTVALTLGGALRAVDGDSGAAEPWAHGLIGMVHTAGDWWVTRRTISREQLVEYLVTLSWDGMASRFDLKETGHASDDFRGSPGS